MKETAGHPSSFILHPLLLDHYRKRRMTWHDPSRYAPANGPICPWKSWPASAASSATTAWSWPAGAIISRSIRPWPSRTIAARSANCWNGTACSVFAISDHLVGQAVLDNIDAAAPGHPAAGGLGRRRSGGRQRPGRRGDEEHRPRGAEVRRQRGQRLHRFEHLALALFLPAGAAGDDRRRLQAVRRAVGIRSSTCSASAA